MTDAELIEVADEFWHQGATTGGAWVRVDLNALADELSAALESTADPDARVAATVADCFEIGRQHAAVTLAGLGR